MDFQEVRQRIGGIRGVVRALDGKSLSGDRLVECPFCSAKRSKAGFFKKEGVEFFKCHAPGCSSGNKAMSEVGYIACREGLSEDPPSGGGASPAYERLLRLAGCWEEPKRKENPNLPEDLVANARRLVIQKQSANLRMLKDAFKIGQDTAIALLGELERQGVVGPARERQPREVLIKENLPSSDGVPAEAVERDGSAAPSEQIMCEAIELLRLLTPETPATTAWLEKFLKVGTGKAEELMAEMQRNGWLDAENHPKKLPDKPIGLVVMKLDDGISFDWSDVKAAPFVIGPGASAAPAQSKPEAVEELRPGQRALRLFYDRLKPTDVQMVPFLPGSPLPDPIPNEVLRKIKFKPVSLYERRGHTPKSCVELGYRANPRSNEGILRTLAQELGMDEMIAAGLYLEADPRRKLERRPNPQFYGKGQVGKKPETERRDEDDKWQWGWCEPVLIPYFDALGQVIKLRPHKGGAKASTVAGEEHIYVPRAYRTAGDRVEKFPEVVICEGEYKASAIWQTIGAGAEEWFGDQPVGVCALPGISFSKSPAMREELEDWLREVECKKGYVAFDDEDNSHKPLRQRFDAQIYARYLAEDLQRKLHIPFKVVTLPREWRNSKGKADWDGALAKLVQAEAVQDAAAPLADEPPPEVADAAAEEWSSPD